MCSTYGCRGSSISAAQRRPRHRLQRRRVLPRCHHHTKSPMSRRLLLLHATHTLIPPSREHTTTPCEHGTGAGEGSLGSLRHLPPPPAQSPSTVQTGLNDSSTTPSRHEPARSRLCGMATRHQLTVAATAVRATSLCRHSPSPCWPHDDGASISPSPCRPHVSRRRRPAPRKWPWHRWSVAWPSAPHPQQPEGASCAA